MILYSDECGVYLLPFVQTTWAAKGKTPSLWEHCGYEHLSIIGAISPAGNLVFWCRRCSFDGQATADFLAWTGAHFYRKHKIILIWDGAKIHNSAPVKEYLIHHPGKIHLERLPAYSPELNPMELMWAYLKKSMSNQIFLNLDQLEEAVCEELTKIKNNRKLVQSFFRKKEIGFFS
ncbi:MAG: IS630 family transposase [Saprospiraceae bacterium]